MHGLKLDSAILFEVKQTERDLIFGIGLRKEVLESGPVGQGQLAGFPSVCYAEQNTILLALDFVLWREMLAWFSQIGASTASTAKTESEDAIGGAMGQRG